MVKLLAVLSLTVLCGGGAAAQVRPLDEVEMGGGDTHTYRFNLTAGQFVRALVEQRGVDVVLTLTGPDGAERLRVDSPVGSWGPEPLFFRVETSGYYTLYVRPRRQNAAPGRYTLFYEARRTLAPGENSFPAESAFAEGVRLLGGPASERPRAFEKFKEARWLFNSARDRRGEAIALTMAASAYSAIGQKQDALNHFRDALKVVQEGGDDDPAGRAETLSDIAEVYHSLGNHEQALKHFEEARDLFTRLGDNRMAAYTYLRMGAVHDSAGESKESVKDYARARDLFHLARDAQGESYALNNLGLAYDALGKAGEERDKSGKKARDEYGRKARENYDSALALLRADRHSKESPYCHALAPALSNMAFYELDHGDKQKALEYLNEALALQRGAGDREGEAKTLNNIGFVYHTLGDQPKALDHLTQALIIHREVKDLQGDTFSNLQGEGDTFSNMMFVWRAAKKPAAAIFYGKQAVNDYQEVRSHIEPLDRDAQQSFIKSKESAYRTLAELLIDGGRLLEAQQVLRMLKEEEYFDFVRRSETEAAASGRAPLSDEETKLRERTSGMRGEIVARGRRLNELVRKANRTAEEEQELLSLRAEVNAQLQNFQKEVNQLLDQFGGGKTDASVPELKDVRRMMKALGELDSTVALYTFVFDEKYTVILLTPSAPVKYDYPIKAAELNRKVSDFREALQEKKDPLPLAKELYRILIEPVEKDLERADAKTLMWSLDGVLRYVPVAALYDAKRQKYMVELYDNAVFTPAYTDGLTDPPTPKWKALGFGVSQAWGEEFPKLPEVSKELNTIIRDETKPGGDGVLSGKVLLDEKFTEDALERGLQSTLEGGLRHESYQAVHIASHFKFNPGNDTESFLLLGNGQHLPLKTISSRPNFFGNLELLTLSACDTAASGVGPGGKEVESFATLAQKRGARAVIASLWPVADPSTSLLMQHFYSIRDARPGITKARALREAQLATKAQYPHPYFWAPFILIGNWR